MHEVVDVEQSRARRNQGWCSDLLLEVHDQSDQLLHKAHQSIGLLAVQVQHGLFHPNKLLSRCGVVDVVALCSCCRNIRGRCEPRTASGKV
eukprot:4915638-Amphidinium_carterae.1